MVLRGWEMGFCAGGTITQFPDSDKANLLD
jgi:hypothetical protein